MTITNVEKLFGYSIKLFLQGSPAKVADMHLINMYIDFNYGYTTVPV